VALAVILVIIRWHDHVPAPLYHLLKPLQWTYRLMAPAALAGAVCLALAFDAALRALPARGARVAAVVATLAYLVLLSTAYFYGQGKWYGTTPAELVSDAFASPNTSGYALRGTNYRDLRIALDDGTLNTGRRIAIPYEGYPTLVEMALRPERPGGELDVVLGDPADPMDARNPDLLRQGSLRHPADPLVWSDVTDRVTEKSRLPDGALRLRFSFVPAVGLVPADAAVRFESRPAGMKWKVDDLTFRRVGEPPERACRVPRGPERTRDGRRAEFAVTVEPDKAGLYQLPVYHLPSNDVRVNGGRVGAPPSGNRAMVVVPLRAGKNVIKIRTRPTRPAAWASAIAVSALCAGAVFVTGRGRSTGAEQP
jgi:hypothetical protein